MTTAELAQRGALPNPDVGKYEDVNRDVLKVLSRPGKGWWILFTMAAAGVGLFLTSWFYQIYKGIGVSGLNAPVGWGVYITTFVFWVGIAHSGTLISAILFLFRAPWRQAIYRASEAMTVFAVMTAGLFPLIHVGRVWHAYWLVPYPNARFLWPNFRSPLVWDVFAITTYFTVSAVFFYLGTIPDLAAARDHARGLRKKFYQIISLGWRGTDREWHHFSKAYIYLAALATPLVLSVHSVVSWDFAMAIVPGWHTTIFAPYFVAGAIFSGVALVITLAVPMRKFFGLEDYLTVKHFEAMAKLCMLTSLIVLYAYLVEYFLAWYSGEPPERGSFWNRVFGHYWWANWIMLTCNGLVPLMLWVRRVRRSIAALFVISIFINIGMWFERFVIIVTSLSHEYEPWAWGLYRPSVVEMGILIGSFAWFGFWFLLFTRLLPPVAIAEMKEVIPPPRRGRVKEGAA
ncbi:MAG: hydrogenase [Gemmatimonadetes bacterium]|nr:polysulfide reductase NrfD [Gemmatimonadota bacterium]MYA42478.1 hydrogenase [Gemmatimonadota bacterium]MYE95622.1 hydrogenase [Gemmatimonadota bacterium]